MRRATLSLTSPVARRWAGLFLVAGLLLWAPSGPSAETADQGAVNLTAALGKLAGDVKTYLVKDAREDSIAVGTFSGPPQLASSSGAAFKKLLTDELTGLEIRCTNRARLSCEGRYSFDATDASVRLKTTLFEGSTELKTFDKKVYDVEDITSLLGVTGKLALDGPERSQDLTSSIQKPQVHVGPGDKGTTGSIRISATKDSPYAIEIHVKNAQGEYVPRPAIDDAGQAFVELSRDEFYAIRVINNTPFATAVTITIDGLNLFEFSEIDPFRQLGKMLIPAGSEGFLLKGWHINNQQSAEFQVSDAANAAVAGIKRLGVAPLSSDSEIGTITASFAVAVPETESFPPDEPLSQDLLGTKVGPRIDQNYKAVPMKIGRLREAVSVRYSKP